MSILGDDDEEDMYRGLYEGGTWEWDDATNCLKFVSDPQEEIKQVFIPAAIVGSLNFKDDMDILEQQKFKRRIQRKIEGPNDVVTLQDVKDLVLYMAPPSLLSIMIIHLLHTPSTERFLRALILYCEYYAQVFDIMKIRTVELGKKIRTSNTDQIEAEYRENLVDMRLLVAKEYCAMILEMEINRLFRSKKFNIMEHKHKIDADDMVSFATSLFKGVCLEEETNLKVHSPLFEEIECARDIDFRVLGLGVLRMKGLNARLQLLEQYIALDETEFAAKKISLGIIGLQRDNFDNMLREVHKESPSRSTIRGSISSTTSGGSSTSSVARLPGRSRASIASKKSSLALKKLIDEIQLPRKNLPSAHKKESLPEEFPEEICKPLVINKVQLQRWLDRVKRMKTMYKSGK